MKAQSLIAAVIASAVIGISSYHIASAATGQATLVCYPASSSDTVNANTTAGNNLSCRTLASVMMDPSTGKIRKPQHASNATPDQVDYAWNALLREELLAGH